MTQINICKERIYKFYISLIIPLQILANILMIQNNRALTKHVKHNVRRGMK